MLDHIATCLFWLVGQKLVIEFLHATVYDCLQLKKVCYRDMLLFAYPRDR